MSSPARSEHVTIGTPQSVPGLTRPGCRVQSVGKLPW
jgi:hypothetical protein